MDLTNKLLLFEKEGYINRKPKPLYVFLLGFSYLLIWYFTITFYLKYKLTSLNLWIFVLTIITIFTFIWAIIHLYILKLIGNKKSLPKYLDEE